MAKKDRLGDRFQKDVQDAMHDLMDNRRVCMPVRLYDPKSARGKYLPEQPADFIVSSKTGAHMIEVKASEVHDSLRSCLDMVETHQAAALRVWKMVGQPSWVLFYSQPKFTLELWDGEVAGQSRATGKKLPKEGKEGGPLVVRRDTLTDLLFNLFTK